jgi:hypothetical protein
LQHEKGPSWDPIPCWNVSSCILMGAKGQYMYRCGQYAKSPLIQWGYTRN